MTFSRDFNEGVSQKESVGLGWVTQCGSVDMRRAQSRTGNVDGVKECESCADAWRE